MDSRNSDNYAPPIKQQVEKLPWQAEALTTLRQLGVSEYIRKGFAKVREIEVQPDPTFKRGLQLEHLLAIADHEQRVVLQPLIYAEPDFAYWIGVQRAPVVNWVTPGLELVFSQACSIDDEEMISEAPDGTILENEKSRMDWISKAAEKFHSLMMRKPAYMEAQLSAMAGWHQMADR